jgi:DNA sulfur modification protein DndD
VTPVDGNTQPVQTTEIDAVIDSILDRRVKDYFLFDGEKIERLTRASIEQRREISAGIRNSTFAHGCPGIT